MPVESPAIPPPGTTAPATTGGNAGGTTTAATSTLAPTRSARRTPADPPLTAGRCRASTSRNAAAVASRESTGRAPGASTTGIARMPSRGSATRAGRRLRVATASHSRATTPAPAAMRKRSPASASAGIACSAIDTSPARMSSCARSRVPTSGTMPSSVVSAANCSCRLTTPAVAAPSTDHSGRQTRTRYRTSAPAAITAATVTSAESSHPPSSSTTENEVSAAPTARRTAAERAKPAPVRERGSADVRTRWVSRTAHLDLRHDAIASESKPRLDGRRGCRHAHDGPAGPGESLLRSFDLPVPVLPGHARGHPHGARKKQTRVIVDEHRESGC